MVTTWVRPPYNFSFVTYTISKPIIFMSRNIAVMLAALNRVSHIIYHNIIYIMYNIKKSLNFQFYRTIFSKLTIVRDKLLSLHYYIIIYSIWRYILWFVETGLWKFYVLKMIWPMEIKNTVFYFWSFKPNGTV